MKRWGLVILVMVIGIFIIVRISDDKKGLDCAKSFIISLSNGSADIGLLHRAFINKVVTEDLKITRELEMTLKNKNMEILSCSKTESIIRSGETLYIISYEIDGNKLYNLRYRRGD